MGQILLVRHGQASFGAEDYDVLSQTGWAQGRRLGSFLGDQGLAPTALVRGDMRRHRETAEAMVETSGWPVPATQIDAGWDEFDHVGIVSAYPDLPSGEMDRKLFQQVFEAATARWIAGVGDYPETYADFVGRVRGSLARACEQAGSGETVVVVTSGGPIGVVGAALVDPEADAASAARMWARFNTVVVNTGVTRIVVGSTGPRLLTYNEHTHLDGEHLTYR
ncbi:histidine phosphatase family protein [Nocardioides salsibiostraticola]